MSKKQQGLAPKDRKLVKTPRNGKQLQANQWQGTPQQLAFMEYWLNPNSATFGNAYQSAIQAGYSQAYATRITSPEVSNKWLSEYDRLTNLTAEHIQQGIQQIAISANNSKSPDDTRLKAYQTLAEIHKLTGKQQGTTVNIVQPILGGASVDKIQVDNETVIKNP